MFGYFLIIVRIFAFLVPQPLRDYGTIADNQ